MNFKDIGVDTLQASKAFKQIRASARIYTTNIIHNPSTLTSKYVKLNNLFSNTGDFNDSISFGHKRQPGLTSTAATTVIHSTFLDRGSLNKFLDYNLQYNRRDQGTNLFSKAGDVWSKGNSRGLSTPSLNALVTLLEKGNKYNVRSLRVLLTYPNLVKQFGNNSDKKQTNFPLRRLIKRRFTKPLRKRLLNRPIVLNSIVRFQTTSKVSPYFKLHMNNSSRTSKVFFSRYFMTDLQFKSNLHSLRKYSDLELSKRYKLNQNTTNLSLSLGLNSIDSNLSKFGTGANYLSPFYLYSLQRSNWADSTVFNKLASNRTMYRNFSPILSNDIKLSRLNFDKHFVTLGKVLNKTSFKLPGGLADNRSSVKFTSLKTPKVFKFVIAPDTFSNGDVEVSEATDDVTSQPLSDSQTLGNHEGAQTPLSCEVEQVLHGLGGAGSVQLSALDRFTTSMLECRFRTNNLEVQSKAKKYNQRIKFLKNVRSGADKVSTNPYWQMY